MLIWISISIVIRTWLHSLTNAVVQFEWDTWSSWLLSDAILYLQQWRHSGRVKLVPLLCFNVIYRWKYSFYICIRTRQNKKGLHIPTREPQNPSGPMSDDYQFIQLEPAECKCISYCLIHKIHAEASHSLQFFNNINFITIQVIKRSCDVEKSKLLKSSC